MSAKATTTMSEAGVRERARMVAAWVEEYGREAVERWAADPVTRSAVNAMAEMAAESRRAS